MIAPQAFKLLVGSVEMLSLSALIHRNQRPRLRFWQSNGLYKALCLHPLNRQMKQLTIKPTQLEQCPWARPAYQRLGVVLAIPKPLPLGLAPWLLSRGWRLAGYAEDRGQSAALLVGGNPADLLTWLPPPPKRGSQTPGEFLPW